MAFKSGVVPEDLRFALIVPLYKGKGERTECKNYRGGVPEFNGTGIQKPPCYLKVDLTCNFFLLYIYCEVRLD